MCAEIATWIIRVESWNPVRAQSHVQLDGGQDSSETRQYLGPERHRADDRSGVICNVLTRCADFRSYPNNGRCSMSQVAKTCRSGSRVIPLIGHLLR